VSLYVLLLDKKLDYIRLFRADCPVRPSGRVLWEGDGLRNAYRAMKDLNSRRRPAIVYHVAEKETTKKVAVRIFKKDLRKGWKTRSIQTSYAEAKEAARILREVLNSERLIKRAKVLEDRSIKRQQNEVIMKRLAQVGVKGKRPPKLTDKDLRYLEWYESKKSA
jgi:hypothetical protein